MQLRIYHALRLKEEAPADAGASLTIHRNIRCSKFISATLSQKRPGRDL
jgi:hypothetical protein